MSQLRQPGMHRVPGLLGPSALDVAGEDVHALSPLDFTSRMIGRILQQGLELCQQGGGIAVNYSELPGALGGRLAPLFGVGEADAPRLREVAAFDAKQPSMWFSADTARKQSEADDDIRTAVARWAGDSYAELESIRCKYQ
ncbi:hypothetical protein D3C78_1282440 [compost metagenome]